jgi:MurE/MurF fusion protein
MSPALPRKTLPSLLRGVDYRLVTPCPGEGLAEICPTAVSVDSRQVCRGALFVALRGSTSDGHDYIAAAVASGCQAIICERGRLTAAEASSLAVAVLEVADSSAAYAAISANYFGRPAEQLCCVAVTGTNGKTTVTYLLEQILRHCGRRVGVIGTVESRFLDLDGREVHRPARFTTPEAFELQGTLREMADHQVEYVVMEVSSHALAQKRIGGITFAAAAFTNLSRDHLDYHRDMAEYFQAKAVLFAEHLTAAGVAVLPQLPGEKESARWLPQLHAICQERRRITWGAEPGADIHLVGFAARLDKTELTVELPSGRWSLVSPLIGRFNIDNLLCAMGLGLALGLEEEGIFPALATASGAPGRLERVGTPLSGQPGEPVVLVDYAHTPDALEKVLHTLQALPHRRLYTVFGCGGNRDRGKRPLMGEIAARCSDVAIITDDNPRNEDPDGIVAEILPGCLAAGMAVRELDWLAHLPDGERGCLVIRDRRQAITAAIRAAGENDLVLIAGKGHEPYQLSATGKRFFDDRRVAAGVLLGWTAAQVAEATGGTLYRAAGQPRLLGPVSTDSRHPCGEGIFVALRGDSHDGHDYLGQAVAGGAACLVVDHLVDLPGGSAVNQVQVADTLQALGDLAAYRRRLLAKATPQVLVAITGSCGKTTVKEMTAAILMRQWPEGPDHPPGTVLKTRGNFNNLIGLPLSLLPIDLHHRAAVMEMGMNRAGELRRLAAIADPDVCCITNIHPAHLVDLQTIEGVARAKEELFAGSGPAATLVINRDNPQVASLAGRYRQKQISFSLTDDGCDPPADFWASEVHFLPEGEITFTLHYHQQSGTVHLHTAGEHNVANALAAAAIATAAGAGFTEVITGLEDFRPADKRMVIEAGATGLVIINDTYNANPASMAMGLKTLKQLAEGRTAVALIGDMLELGDTSVTAHRQIGRLVAELGIDYLGVAGEFRDQVVEAAVEAGFPSANARSLAAKELAVEWVERLVAEKNLGRDLLVLVKASRGLRFETIVAQLVGLKSRG